MRVLSYVILAIAAAVTIYPAQTDSQTPQGAPNPFVTLNKEAEATDLAGLHEYIQRLVGMLAGIDNLDAAYRASFTDRLARAELLARKGKRKLISETAIVESFNDLMRRTGAPGSVRADVAEVKKSRRGFKNELPAIISESRNGEYCNPGEAVWVIESLIENTGTTLPQLNPGPHVLAYMPPVRVHLIQYFSSHSQRESTDALDRLAKGLGI